MNYRTRYILTGSLWLIIMMVFMAADEGYTLVREVGTEGNYIRSDELGNIFVVNEKQLTKYDKAGKKLHTYTNLYAGNISYVDTHDPFKILLFYQTFSQIEFLDHTLSLTSSRIDLNDIALGLATLACASYQGAFWVYDPTNFELVRVKQSLEIAERSGNLQQATGIALNPNYMIERDNYLYLNDPSAGILIFDKYGTYYKTIPVTGLASFQVFNSRIIYFSNGRVNIFDTQRNEESSTTLPDTEARSFSVCLSLDPQLLFALGKDKLMIYEIK